MPVSTFRQPHQLLQPEETIATASPECGTVKVVAPKKKRRLAVQFKETVSVRPIRHVNAMADEEIEQVWYCKSDFDRMKRSFAATVKMITIGLYEGDDEDVCARGLEFRTRAGALRRRENKLNALNAVLDEQDRQRDCGVFDDTMIRKIYVDENLHCRVASMEMGKHDQEEARRLRLEDEQQDEDLPMDSDSSEEEMDYCDMYNNNTSLTRAPQRKITTITSQRMVE